MATKKKTKRTKNPIKDSNAAAMQAGAHAAGMMLFELATGGIWNPLVGKEVVVEYIGQAEGEQVCGRLESIANGFVRLNVNGALALIVATGVISIFEHVPAIAATPDEPTESTLTDA